MSEIAETDYAAEIVGILEKFGIKADSLKSAEAIGPRTAISALLSEESDNDEIVRQIAESIKEHLSAENKSTYQSIVVGTGPAEKDGETLLMVSIYA